MSHRRLSDLCRYVCISYEGPEGRLPVFARSVEQGGGALMLSAAALEEAGHNHVYVLQKPHGAVHKAEALSLQARDELQA
jgi:hypothetical protein